MEYFHIRCKSQLELPVGPLQETLFVSEAAHQVGHVAWVSDCSCTGMGKKMGPGLRDPASRCLLQKKILFENVAKNPTFLEKYMVDGVDGPQEMERQ